MSLKCRELCRGKGYWDYKIYSKIIRWAEEYLAILVKSNCRQIDAQSLKASKYLLKIAYGIKQPIEGFKELTFNYLRESKEKKNKNKVLSLKSMPKERKVEIENLARCYEGLSHENKAYRMAFGIPSAFTKEESLSLITKPMKIID
jgi:hypothetical protein